MQANFLCYSFLALCLENTQDNQVEQFLRPQRRQEKQVYAAYYFALLFCGQGTTNHPRSVAEGFREFCLVALWLLPKLDLVQGQKDTYIRYLVTTHLGH